MKAGIGVGVLMPNSCPNQPPWAAYDATPYAATMDKRLRTAAFTAIGNDNSAPQVFRDAAKVRAAWLLVDNGTYDQVAALAEPLSTDGQTMRASAREALGLAAYKAGDFAKAIGLDIDLSGFGLGLRSKRYAMLVDDGVVKILNVEDSPPVAEKSSAANLCSMIDCTL